MADIPVYIAADVKKSGVLIDPKKSAVDVYNSEQNVVIEADNVLAEATSGRAALKKFFEN